MSWGTGYSSWGGGWRQALTTNTIVPSTADTEDLGSASKEWDELFLGDDAGAWFGLDQDWHWYYDETTTDAFILAESTVPALAIKGSAISSFAGVADAAGNALYFELQTGGAKSASGNGLAGASGYWNAGGGSAAHTAGDGGAGGDWVFEPGVGGALAGGGATGADGKFIIRQPGGTPGTNEVQVWHSGTHGFVESMTGSIYLKAAANSLGWNGTALTGSAGTSTMGTASSEWKSMHLSEDSTSSTLSGIHFGFAQEARLRYNKDATGYPANTLILGLEASGTAAKDSLAFSSATVSGFNAITNVDGRDTFIATQSGLDNNKDGGDLTWEMGAPNGAGTGGAFVIKGAANVFSMSYAGVLSTNSINPLAANTTLTINTLGVSGASGDIATLISSGTASNTTGEFTAVSIAPTINQASGDGSWIGLLLDVTTTNVGSGGGEFLVFKDDSTTMFAISAEGGINMATGADLTIATGVVAYGGARMHRIVVEGGAGSGNDALTSITGGVDGDEIIIAPKTSGGADTVTVTDGGTLDIAGDFAMDSTSDRMHLRHDGSAWVEISRSSNA